MHDLLVNETLPAYVARLAKQHQLKTLGAGMFAKVFQHPTFDEVVVKVVSNHDRNYLQYLRWATTRQHNPYVPQLYDFYTCGRGKKKFSIVFMEKLKSAPYCRLLPKLDKLFNECGAIDLLDPDRPGVVRQLLRRTIKRTEDDNLREVCKYVLEKHGRNTDMHHGNFMLRGPQVVFTDPVMSYIDYYDDDFPDPLWFSKEYK